MQKHLLLLLVLTGLVFQLSSCIFNNAPEERVTSDEVTSNAQPLVVASNYPAFFLADRIGGDAIDLRLPVQGDPSAWKPSGEDIATMQQADLILFNGATLEKWAETVSLPSAKVVRTSDPFNGQLLESEEVYTHSHGGEGEHEHRGIAPLTWTDLLLAAVQAETTYNALLKLLPGNEEQFKVNLIALVNELNTLDAEIKAVTSKDPHIAVFYAQPNYQYFRRAYSIRGSFLDFDPASPPSPEQWVEFEEGNVDYPRKWMIWNSAPQLATSEALLRKGVECIVIDPCMTVPAEGDFLSVMQRNLEALKPMFGAK